MREAEVLPGPAGRPADATAGRPPAGRDGPGTPDGASTPRKPGRPRSERADRAILEAALELFTEAGTAGVCMEAVAARAGVGKATIYRRWPGKEDLLLDALTSLKSPLPEPRGESVRDDLVAILRVMCTDASDPTWVSRYTLLLGEGKKYPKVMQRYKATVVEPRREVIRSVLRRGVASGELRPDAEIETAVLMMGGVVLSAQTQEPGWFTPDFPDLVADVVLRGLASC
jgi:AcrR family transcriptional regulator